MRPDVEIREEEEDLNEGMLKSIVKSIFLRNRLRKKDRDAAKDDLHSEEHEAHE